jgi:hypothetical protein
MDLTSSGYDDIMACFVMNMFSNYCASGSFYLMKFSEELQISVNTVPQYISYGI